MMTGDERSFVVELRRSVKGGDLRCSCLMMLMTIRLLDRKNQTIGDQRVLSGGKKTAAGYATRAAHFKTFIEEYSRRFGRIMLLECYAMHVHPPWYPRGLEIEVVGESLVDYRSVLLRQ